MHFSGASGNASLHSSCCGIKKGWRARSEWDQTRSLALIEDAEVVRRILEHLGLWAPLPTERSPPLAAASWPRRANLPLTYHPLCTAAHNAVPDVA